MLILRANESLNEIDDLCRIAYAEMATAEEKANSRRIARITELEEAFMTQANEIEQLRAALHEIVSMCLTSSVPEPRPECGSNLGQVHDAQGDQS